MNEKNEMKYIHELLMKVISSHDEMIKNIAVINGIVKEMNFLSVNSAIEAARAGSEGRCFSVIAEQMREFCNNSTNANGHSISIMENLNENVNNVIGVRTADVAFDLIDKIDRNLFERNCDVQAWATFGKVKNYVSEQTEVNKVIVTELLKNIHNIYEVYHDIVISNLDGKIIAAASNQNLLGRDVSESEWFRGIKDTRETYVTDMHLSKTVGKYTISYSCKIFDDKGVTCGIITTYFNWDYIYDIIDRANVGGNAEIYLIKSNGDVIASRKRDDVLKFNLSEKYRVVDDVINGKDYGFEIQKNKDILNSVFGYAHTRGYNSYKGKEWSVIVKEVFR